MNKLLYTGLLFLGAACLTLKGADASIYNNERVDVRAELKLQHIFDDDMDLGTAGYGWRSNNSAQGILRSDIDLGKGVSSYIEVRGVWSPGDGITEDVNGDVVSGASFYEWREHWVQYEDETYLPGAAVQFGRQRVKEEKALWWNNNLDMLRFKYNSTLFDGFVGFGENLASYRTLHDDFDLEHRDRFRFLGEGVWHMGPDKTWELRFLYEDDHSKTDPVGTIVNADDIDYDDGQLLWLGGRTTGNKEINKNNIKKFNYNIDVMGLFGKNTKTSTVAGPVNRRTVSALNNRTVRAWAMDALLNFHIDTPQNIVCSIGYAFGSGDSGSASTDAKFRQTDMHSSFSNIVGNTKSSVAKYGEVLRPELSNLHIFTAAAKLPFKYRKFKLGGDVSFLYHYYHLDDTADTISDKIDASLDGTHKSVGHAFDVVSHIDLDRSLFFGGEGIEQSYLKVSLGSFFAGDAFGTNSGEDAYRGSLALFFKF